MIDIVVGGQFGSEGKGKVAYFLCKKSTHKCVVRVGGSNSGHTADGVILRHLPVSALMGGLSIIGAGSYIDLKVLLSEIRTHQPKLLVDENATIIDSTEPNSLLENIGSTLSGTGSAVQKRVSRQGATLAKDVPALKEYTVHGEFILDTISGLGGCIIEGTQGFGLSLLHSPYYPYVTSRDTTASAFASELGVSPKLVNDIILVIRAYPIRVCGNSGLLKHETDWSTIGIQAEYTSVTKKVRRVGLFDPDIVRLAIKYNTPTHVVLNHLDYVDIYRRNEFIKNIERTINRKIEFVGLGCSTLVPRETIK